jgi:SAM-dependent methyltransferase
MPRKLETQGGDIPAWERFAQANAEYYILTSSPPEMSPESMERFFATGCQQADAILAEAAPWLRGYGKAIDIGCGVGRLAIPMAKRFERVVGVDIAPTMLDKLRANAVRFEAPNIEGIQVEQCWEAAGDADFLYSWLVLQHIEPQELIARLIARTAAALSPTGVAYLQFDTRPRTLCYRLRSYLPDALLPAVWRSGLRRVRRAPATLTVLFEEAGLSLLREYRPGTALHSFLLKRR